MPAAAAYLDRVLEQTCPHGPAAWHLVAADPGGRAFVACYGCGVGWWAAEPFTK